VGRLVEGFADLLEVFRFLHLLQDRKHLLFRWCLRFLELERKLRRKDLLSEDEWFAVVIVDETQGAEAEAEGEVGPVTVTEIEKESEILPVVDDAALLEIKESSTVSFVGT